MVIKQIGLRPKDAARGHAWDSQIPHEVLVHFEINAVECDTIVRIRSYKRYPHQQIHRIYLEYCPYGDLRKLYKRYRQFRYVTQRNIGQGFWLLVILIFADATCPKRTFGRPFVIFSRP